MSAEQPDPCLDFVRGACPFPLSGNIGRLAKHLCSKSLEPQFVAWMVLQLVLKPRAPEISNEGEEEDAPYMPPEHFNWKVWLDICKWARDQQAPVPLNILRKVFERVFSGEIRSLKGAIALMRRLLPPPGPSPKPRGP